jgi:F420-0:gamma-glutamyl ligase-like protein
LKSTNQFLNMKNKIVYPALMVLGLLFGTLSSKAQTTTPLAASSPTTELSTSSSNLMASNVETKTNFSEKTIVKKQKASKPTKKEWEDRTLVGKILIIIGGVLFAAICVMYGTVSVG